MDRSYEEEMTYQRIKMNLVKAVPAFTLLNVPFGGPLFFVYLQLFPNFTPTWILTERIYKGLLGKYE